MLGNTLIDTEVKYELYGISNGVVESIGEVYLTIGGLIVAFQVVRDDFQIPENGLIGSQYLEQAGADISYKYKHLKIGDVTIPFLQPGLIELPPYSETQVYVRVTNAWRVPVGYLERVKTESGVYIGESLVTTNNGIAQTYALNTTALKVVMEIPEVKLKAYDTEETMKRARVCRCEAKPEKGDRVQNIVDLMDISHLDAHEQNGTQTS